MFTNFFNYVRKRKRYAQARHSLESMNDRELRDIGISRCDIRQVTRM